MPRPVPPPRFPLLSFVRRLPSRRVAVLPGALLAASMLCLLPSASAMETGRYVFDPGGKPRAVRALDMDGDGRADLVLVVEPRGHGTKIDEVVVLRTPTTPAAKTFFSPGDALRFPASGDLASAGAVAVGRFGPGGAPRLRFLGPEGVLDVMPDGSRAPADPRLAVPTLLARSTARPLVVWDAHADLDGDGVEEVWFPDGAGNGAIRVLGGTAAGDRLLTLEARNLGTVNPEFAWLRTAWVPNLVPADLDGDGKRELVALEGKALVAWSLSDAPDAATGRLAPSYRLQLPFLQEVPLGPEETRTPRLQVADANGDGIADLLVTVVTGRRDQLGSLRTTLYHFPGPFRDAATGGLVLPKARIDTESAAIHARFVDLDGDGALDYLSDSIRGTRIDLLQRVMGKEPEMTYVAFRFDRAQGTFETVPYFTVARAYSTAQAVSNQFGVSAWFDGDFDGDGHRDLLDLGNLGGLEILGAAKKRADGPGDPVAFTTELVRRAKVTKTLEPQAVVTDLTGDGRAEAVAWNEDALFLVVPTGAR